MTKTHQGDEILVAKAQAGDKRAFEMLMAKYERRVTRLVATIVFNNEDVEEVVQDTFVKVYRKLGSFRYESAFFTWLYKIAINSAKNTLLAKVSQTTPNAVVLDNFADLDLTIELHDQHTPEHALSHKQFGLLLGDAMQSLPPGLRDALELRILEGCSYDEIANQLNCPVGTVRSRISRARNHVIEQMAPIYCE